MTCVGDDGEPGVSRKFQTRFISNKILTIPLILMTWEDDGFGEETKESFERAPATFKMNLEATRLNAFKSLENDDVGLKFHLKMLEFMNSMNQNHKFGKDNKVRQDK